MRELAQEEGRPAAGMVRSRMSRTATVEVVGKIPRIESTDIHSSSSGSGSGSGSSSSASPPVTRMRKEDMLEQLDEIHRRHDRLPHANIAKLDKIEAILTGNMLLECYRRQTPVTLLEARDVFDKRWGTHGPPTVRGAARELGKVWRVQQAADPLLERAMVPVEEQRRRFRQRVADEVARRAAGAQGGRGRGRGSDDQSHGQGQGHGHGYEQGQGRQDRGFESSADMNMDMGRDRDDATTRSRVPERGGRPTGEYDVAMETKSPSGGHGEAADQGVGRDVGRDMGQVGVGGRSAQSREQHDAAPTPVSHLRNLLSDRRGGAGGGAGEGVRAPPVDLTSDGGGRDGRHADAGGHGGGVVPSSTTGRVISRSPERNRGARGAMDQVGKVGEVDAVETISDSLRYGTDGHAGKISEVPFDEPTSGGGDSAEGRGGEVRGVGGRGGGWVA